jgi:hypothetical protein
VNRRAFITLIGGTAMTLPSTARAQQSAMPVVGFINGQSPEASVRIAGTFRKGAGSGTSRTNYGRAAGPKDPDRHPGGAMNCRAAPHGVCRPHATGLSRGATYGPYSLLSLFLSRSPTKQ